METQSPTEDDNHEYKRLWHSVREYHDVWNILQVDESANCLGNLRKSCVNSERSSSNLLSLKSEVRNLLVNLSTRSITGIGQAVHEE